MKRDGPTSVDKKRNSLMARTELLHPHAMGVFSAACTERISAFYSEFQERCGWGDFAFARTSLDDLWRYLKGDEGYAGKLAEAEAQVASESVCPHADDFPPVAAIGAQDVCICLSCGIQFALQLPNSAPDAAEASIEILHCIATMMITGHRYHGSHVRRFAIDDEILRDSLVTIEFAAQERDLSRLERYDGPVPADVVEQIRVDAVAARYDAKSLLPRE